MQKNVGQMSQPWKYFMRAIFFANSSLFSQAAMSLPHFEVIEVDMLDDVNEVMGHLQIETNFLKNFSMGRV